MDYLMVSNETLLELYKYCKGCLSGGKFESDTDTEKVSDFIDNIVRPYLDLNKAIETEIKYEVKSPIPWSDYNNLIGRYNTRDDAIESAKRYIAENLEGYEKPEYITKIEFDGDWFNATTQFSDGSDCDEVSIYIVEKEVVK